LLNIGVLVSGSGSNLQSLIDSIKSGYIDGQISIVISDRLDIFALERAKVSGITAVSYDRKSMNVDCMNESILEVLKHHGVQLVVLAGYLSILSKEMIKEYRNAIVNVHPSLIPSFCGNGYYGLKVHKSAIDYGVKVSGCTVHFVDEGTDTGPIILQKAVEVLEDDTPEILQKRVLEYEHQLLPEAVKLICQGWVCISGRKVLIKGRDKND